MFIADMLKDITDQRAITLLSISDCYEHHLID